MSNKCPISLLILTYNEEKNIEHCLRSTHDWVGEIIIIDSYSTDNTLEICKKYTDKIYQHPFENQAKQFNWALDNVPIAYDWIMRLDADEMVTPELAQEMCEALPKLPKEVTGIYTKRRIYFWGRWMKHGGLYPMRFIRTFRKGKGRYEEITEENIILSEGKTIQLKNDFIDYNRKGLSFWTDKHNHWAIGRMKETMYIMDRGGLPDGTVEPSLFGTPEKRKRWLLVKVYARCPMFLRSFLYFCYRYFFLLGFLDGTEGLIFNFLQGFWYNFYIDAKIFEARKFGIGEAERMMEYTSSKSLE